MTDHNNHAADFIFDNNNQERPPWKICGRTCSRTAFLSIFQCLVVLILLLFSIINHIFARTCDERTVWLLFFQVLLVTYFLIPEHKMNKIISTKERILMYLFGPSGSGKTVFINDMLQKKTFQPTFDRILYFYKHFQTIYDTMMQSIAGIEFIQGVDFELIDNLPADGTKYLLIFDDSLDILSKSENSTKLRQPVDIEI